jgi:phage-related baseplate assembly protein
MESETRVIEGVPMMDDDRERRIRERAYEIWERAGRSGTPEDHWLEAERELAKGDAASPSGAADVTGTVPQAPGAVDTGPKTA